MTFVEKSPLLLQPSKRPLACAFTGGNTGTARNVRQRPQGSDGIGFYQTAQPGGNKALQSFVELVFKIEPMWRLAKQMVL